MLPKHVSRLNAQHLPRAVYSVANPLFANERCRLWRRCDSESPHDYYLVHDTLGCHGHHVYWSSARFDPERSMLDAVSVQGNITISAFGRSVSLRRKTTSYFYVSCFDTDVTVDDGTRSGGLSSDCGLVDPVAPCPGGFHALIDPFALETIEAKYQELKAEAEARDAHDKKTTVDLLKAMALVAPLPRDTNFTEDYLAGRFHRSGAGLSQLLKTYSGMESDGGFLMLGSHGAWAKLASPWTGIPNSLVNAEQNGAMAYRNVDDLHARHRYLLGA